MLKLESLKFYIELLLFPFSPAGKINSKLNAFCSHCACSSVKYSIVLDTVELAKRYDYLSPDVDCCLIPFLFAFLGRGYGSNEGEADVRIGGNAPCLLFTYCP